MQKNIYERKISGKGPARAGTRFISNIWNEYMNDIIKIIKSLEDLAVLIIGVTETVKNEIKKQDGRIFGALLAPLATSVLEPVMFSVVKSISGRGVRRAGRGYMDKSFLVSLHSLNRIDITNYLNYKPRFNEIFSRNNLPRLKDGAYVINIDGKQSKGTHWASLFIEKDTVVCCDSFGIEYIPQGVLNKTGDKSIAHNIFRI